MYDLNVPDDLSAELNDIAAKQADGNCASCGAAVTSESEICTNCSSVSDSNLKQESTAPRTYLGAVMKTWKSRAKICEPIERNWWEEWGVALITVGLGLPFILIYDYSTTSGLEKLFGAVHWTVLQLLIMPILFLLVLLSMQTSSLVDMGKKNSLMLKTLSMEVAAISVTFIYNIIVSLFYDFAVYITLGDVGLSITLWFIKSGTVMILLYVYCGIYFDMESGGKCLFVIFNFIVKCVLWLLMIIGQVFLVMEF